ncbi:MAG: HAD-IA family hydrolase [Candidatus Obscuribacterales bacterium]|nr:HAD-IA family hydrolase [Candidatus Obscuribacterales bacterium]
MVVKAVAFDAFGTACRIADPRNPYGKLFRILGIDKDEAKIRALTQALGFSELAVALSGGEPPSELLEDLACEIASIELFSETREVLAELKQRGLKIAVVSNLAQPFGEPVQSLLGDLVDHFVFSFVTGVAKPNPEIFEEVCRKLELSAPEILFVGDNKQNDYEGALAFGMSALHLQRSSQSVIFPIINNLQGVTEYLSR